MPLASVVNTVTAFSTGAVGNMASFTGAVTAKTNPVPVATSSTFRGSGRSGGGSQAGALVPVPVPGAPVPVPAVAVCSSTMPGILSFINQNPSGGSKPLAWGIYHYLRESGESKKRIHLRIEDDGSVF